MLNPLGYLGEKEQLCQKGFKTLGAGPILKMVGCLATWADKGTILK
jgi:hypothetical protein